MDMDIDAIVKRLNKFAEDRDWGGFLSPKNIAIALAVEVGELLEIFQWLPENYDYAQDDKIKHKTTEEIADILIYTIMLSNKLNININDAVFDKINKNEAKYPIDKVKGRLKRYTDP